MTHDNTSLENIIENLQTKKLYRAYHRYLPTPGNIQKIIGLTNHGQIAQARKKVEHLEEIVELLDEKSHSKEKAWLLSIISELDHAIDSWKP